MTDKNRPKERRLAPRYRPEHVVDLGTGKAGRAVLRDIGEYGLGCLTDVPFEEMAILEINMKLPHPEGDVDFKAGGAVVRCDATDDGKHSVGIYFTHMDEGNREILDRYLEHLKHEASV